MHQHRPDPPATSPLALLATLRECFERTLTTDPVAHWPARLACYHVDALTALIESLATAPADDVEDIGDADTACIMDGCARPAAGIRYGARGIDYESSSLCFCPAHARAAWLEYEQTDRPDRPDRPKHTRRTKDAHIDTEATDPRDPRD